MMDSSFRILPRFISCVLMCCLSPALLALGLGESRLDSGFNEPLKVTIPLVNMGDFTANEIMVELASEKDFDRRNIERPFWLQTLNFAILDTESGSAQVIITSNGIVKEPYVQFLVNVEWPTGRLLKEITILMPSP